MGRIAPRGRLVVELSAGPNADYSSPDEPLRTMSIPASFVPVDTLAEAQEVCRRFQRSRGMGNGNWTGGMVYDDEGRAVAKVAYGGSVWDPVRWERRIDVKRFDEERSLARTARKLTYFDLDELKDATRMIETKVEDAEDLLTKEEGLFRKFKKLVPKVEKVTKALEDAVSSIADLQETVVEELRESGGMKGQGVAASQEDTDMDRIDAIAGKVARELAAAPQKHGFTELKPIRFKPFYSTAYCLFNARLIQAAGYQLVDGYFTYDTNKGDYKTTAFFVRGEESQSADFFGFSVGYGGEGPHGMMEFGKMFGWNFSEDNVFGRKLIEQADPGSVHLKDM